MTPRGAALWVTLLAAAVALCLVWSSLPDLRAAPLLRVGLFAGLGLLGAGLTMLRPSVGWLLGGALLLRLALLPAAVSDDVHRYLWEGRLVRHGVSPYAHTADDPAWSKWRDGEWERMNHRDRRTAYPPLAELIFAAAGAVAYHPLPLKLLFLASEAGTLLLLLSLLRARGQPLHQLGWYAFNPIALIGIGAEAHYDALFVLALTLSWWATEKKRPALAWLALAASVQLKIVSLALLPFFWKSGTRKTAWVFPIAVLLPCLPFLGSLKQLGNAIGAFAGSGQLNDAPYYVLTRWTGWNWLPPLLFLLTTVFAWVGFLRGKFTATRASLWTLGGLLIFAPVLHFWYLLWILPLLVLSPSVPWLLLCLGQAGYFVAWHTEATQGWWGLPLNVMYAMWLPAAVAAVWVTARRRAAR